MSAKTEGQERSTANLTTEEKAAFWAIIEALKVGQIVHINGLRPLLDFAEIPASSRGGLFAQAVGAGLLTKMLSDGGDEIRRKSNGPSAHQATCCLYTRTVPS